MSGARALPIIDASRRWMTPGLPSRSSCRSDSRPAASHPEDRLKQPSQRQRHHGQPDVHEPSPRGRAQPRRSDAQSSRNE